MLVIGPAVVLGLVLGGVVVVAWHRPVHAVGRGLSGGSATPSGTVAWSGPASPAAVAAASGSAATGSAPAAPAGCQPGVDSVVSLADASAPGGRRSVWIHRPAGPDRVTIPVVYALHGYPADPAAMAATLPQLLDQQICRTGRPFVLAVPDGRSGDLDTEWGDDSAGRFAIETFVTSSAVELVEGDLRRPAVARAIVGFSMGGYGAAALALRHPDEYRQVAAFSGYFHVDDPDRVFGADTARHAPDQLVDAGVGQRYFLVEGTSEDTGLEHGSIRGEADRFAGLLRTAGITVDVTHPPGGHDESTWYPQLGAMVDFLDAGWTATGG
jgi:S-formylglutathione hydrolase FrmB